MAKDLYIQALRGLAIAAVVLIHCLPQCEASVALRPLLNWSVAMFLFLSGVLTTEEKMKRGGVIRRRLLKIAAPYLVWSAIYLLVARPETVLGAFKALLTGGASAQMYYLLVYAQLVVLTPLLFRLLRSHRVLLYAVTPCMLLAWEVLAAFQVDAPRLGILFPAWLIYYLFGLEWSRWCTWLAGKTPLLAVFAVLMLLAQVAEGFLWNAFGDYNMATTQLRVTNMLSSLAVVSAFMLVSSSLRSKLADCRLLVHLGDLSFGVYLCHMGFVMILLKLSSLANISGFAISLGIWLITLSLSALAVTVCQKTFPKHLLSALGFN